MAQVYTVDTYASTQVGTTSLQNMENNFAALKSRFSGLTAPSNLEAFMAWGDTTASVLKRYNAGGTAWLADLAGDSSLKWAIYRNDTAEGWSIDSTITDKVIAIKGGSQAYNANGGTTGGDWSGTGIDWDHRHDMPVSTFSTNDICHTSTWGTGTAITQSRFDGDHTVGSQSHNPLRCSDPVSNPDISGWRPAAAICTLQYPNV